MALEIIPQFAELIPNQELLFTARAPVTPPAYWSMSSLEAFGWVQPDFTIGEFTPPGGSSIAGNGAHHLVSGVGTIEWTLDPQCVPTTSTVFTVTVRLGPPITDVEVSYAVDIRAGDIQIRVDPGIGSPALDTTLPIVPVAGMRFKVEIASGFRLFINDILRHTRTIFTGPVTYPANYSTSIGTPKTVQTAPARIPRVALVGQWELDNRDAGNSPVVVFSVEHGSLIDGPTELQKIYKGGTVPGVYKLRGNIRAGMNVWVEDADLAGAAITSSGGSWVWANSNPAPFAGTNRLKAPNSAGDHFYSMLGATTTLQLNAGDLLVCHVFLDPTNPPTEIMLEWRATDSTSLEHRAYWGANSISLGTNGTPSRWNMGPLPALNQWVRLEVPVEVVDLAGRVLDGIKFRLFDGVCSFDHVGKTPSRLQYAESTIKILPLQIVGPLAINMKPGAKARFQTTYDSNPALIVWTVQSGGGSFSQGEYTAGSAGVSVVRATAAASNQFAEITITVPPEITPNVNFAAPSEVINWDTNVGVPAIPTFVAAGTESAGTGALTPGMPANMLANDVMLLVVQTANEVVTAPLGWLEVADSPRGLGTAGAAGSTRLSMFWKRFVTEDVAPTIVDPGDHGIARIFAFRGCVQIGNPWNVTSGDTGTSSTSVVIPGDTTTVPNCLVVLAVAHATDIAGGAQVSGYTNTDLASLTERGDNSTDNGVGGGFALITGTKATAGTYGTTTATLVSASQQGRMSVALKPPPNWSASAGTIDSVTGEWTAPSLAGQSVKIVVTDGVTTAMRDIWVAELFPRTDFQRPWPIDYAKKVLISEAEDGTRVTRIKTGAKRSFPVNVRVDAVADLNGAGLTTIRNFWDRHHPGVRFILADPEEAIRFLVYSDSELRWEHTDAGINIAFRVKEAKV